MKTMKILAFVIVICYSMIHAQTRVTPQYKDGVYSGTAEGYSGPITVEVRIEKGGVASVQVTDQRESRPGWALRTLPSRIIEGQGPEGIEAITGATITSEAILKATAQALARASMDPAPEEKGPAVKRSLGTRLDLPWPVWVVGTWDASGKAIFTPVPMTGLASDRPPIVSISLKTDSPAARAIIEKKAFTVNVPFDREPLPAGADRRALWDCPLTPLKGGFVDAPLAEEAMLCLECRLLRFVTIEGNAVFFGTVEDVKADESLVKSDGLLSPEDLRPFLAAPGAFRN